MHKMTVPPRHLYITLADTLSVCDNTVCGRSVANHVCGYVGCNLHVAVCGPIGTKFGTHMQIHIEEVVGKIKICPMSRRGEFGGF